MLPSLPIFPSFAWDNYSWVTSASLPAWSGFQIRQGPYCTVSEVGRSNGTVRIVFAPEGRGEAALSGREIEMVRWVIDHQVEVHDAMLQMLFEQYPKITEEVRDWLEEDEAISIAPTLQSPDQLKEIVGIVSIFVHCIEADGIPFVGVELGCTWDSEHGVGILLHGPKPLEIGGADTAFTHWIAEKHSGRLP